MAREALQRLTPVSAEVALQIQTTDRYDGSVAEVFRAGENLNLTLVGKGAAVTFRRYLGQCKFLRYVSAESQAEIQRVGVWAVPGGLTRSWDWQADVNLGGDERSEDDPRIQRRGSGEAATTTNPCQQQAQSLLSQDNTHLDGERAMEKLAMGNFRVRLFLVYSAMPLRQQCCATTSQDMGAALVDSWRAGCCLH